MSIARYVTPALLLALIPTAGFTNQSYQDPSSRVGRLSFLGGPVSLRPGGVDEWTDATINYPLTAGDELWADANGQTEITMDGTALRLAPNTSFGFLALDDQTTQVRLSQGSLQVRLRDLARDETFEIATPNGAVSLLRSGTYRVDVASTGDETTVTVRQGEAEFTAARGAFSVNAGETAVVSGIDSPTYDILDARGPDAWDQWCANRDRRRDQSRSAQYVSRDMPGYEDLDDYGDWNQTPDYGAVWMPRRVSADWAPYRDGRWVWVDPWGWTWVDEAPWGFAPFHYGRWAQFGGRWGWVPGHVVARPVYAPALVVFVGGGNWSMSVAVGGGGVGWFALAPNEMYVPAYHVSQTYVRNINVTNVTNITVVDTKNYKYRNREAPGGVTVVSRETFVGAAPVNRGRVAVERDRLSMAPVVEAAPYAPTRQSVTASNGRPARQPPAAPINRRVVVRNTPPPAPVPFSAREEGLRAKPGRPLDPATVATLRGRGAGTDMNRVRPATSDGGAALKPARGGLPQPRAATPAGARHQPERAAPPARPAPSAEQATPMQPAQPAAQKPAPPARQPQPEQPAARGHEKQGNVDAQQGKPAPAPPAQQGQEKPGNAAERQGKPAQGPPAQQGQQQGQGKQDNPAAQQHGKPAQGPPAQQGQQQGQGKQNNPAAQQHGKPAQEPPAQQGQQQGQQKQDNPAAQQQGKPAPAPPAQQGQGKKDNPAAQQQGHQKKDTSGTHGHKP